MKRSEYGKILEVSSFAGKILLENGAEIYRVEQTVNRICNAYRVTRSECFAAPTTIMISIIDQNGEVHSVMRRITVRKVNLRKVELINRLSREIEKGVWEVDQVTDELIKINRISSYPFAMMVLTAAVGTAAFTTVFGGGAIALAGGFLSGGSIHLLEDLLYRKKAGAFLANLVLGASCALFGGLFSILSQGDNWWVITISSLMLLVPGMLITNALRDLAAGDYLSGLSRGAEAFCIATALAGGAAFVFFIILG